MNEGKQQNRAQQGKTDPVLHSLSLEALTHWGFLLQHWFSLGSLH